jgi:hypothetical protein
MLVFMLTFRLVLLWSRMRLCMLLRVRFRMRRCRVRIGMRLGRMRVRVWRLGRLRFMRPGCGFLSMLWLLAGGGFGRTLWLGLRMLGFRLGMPGFRCMRCRGAGFGRARVTFFRLCVRSFALRTWYAVLLSCVRMQLLPGLRLRSGGIRCCCTRSRCIRRMTRLRLIAVPRSALRTDWMNLCPVDHLEASTRCCCTRRARMCHGSEGSRRRSAYHRCAGPRHFAAARCKALG